MTFADAPKRFPIRFTIFTGPKRGKEVGLIWVDFASEWIDRAEDMAARLANEWQAEVDIETGGVFPSGKISEWSRAGMRVRPC